jgi:hypothetical protein
MTPSRDAPGDGGCAGFARAGGAPDGPAAPRRTLLRNAQLKLPLPGFCLQRGAPWAKPASAHDVAHS